MRILIPFAIVSIMLLQSFGAYTCGTVTSPGGVCQFGTCPPANRCETAISCSSACTSAGATTCDVCVNLIVVQLCQLIERIRLVAGSLALLLFIFGGMLFAAAHMLPQNLRNMLHGFAVAMIVASIISLAIMVLAGPIITAIANPGNVPVASCSTVAL